MGVNPNQLSQDKDFLAMSPQDQTGYLSSQDPDFAKMTPADQAGYISHLTGKSVQTAPNAGLAPPAGGQPQLTKVNGKLVGPPSPIIMNAPTEEGFGESFLNAASPAGASGQPSDIYNGPKQLLTHPIDSLKMLADAYSDQSNSEFNQAKNAFANKDYIRAGVHGLGYAVPFVGPLQAKAAEQSNAKNFAGAAGTTAGIAAPMLIGEAPRGVQMLNDAADNFTRSPIEQAQKATSDFTKAIPPTKSTPYTPEDVQAARPYLDQEHATSPIETVVNARDAADASIKGIENQVSQRLAQNPTALIDTRPLDAVRAALAPTDALKSGFLDAGLKELAPYNLDKPMTIAKADAMRRLFNTENSAYAAANKYDVAQARATSPAYAAREAAVASLRDGIYQGLEDRGFSDVYKLRQDEGSLLKIRDAAQNQIFNGEKNVGGTGSNSRVGKNLVRVGTTGGGAALGHAIAGGPGATAGAIVGGGVGEAVNSALFPGNLSRDALVKRSFSVSPLQIAPPESLAGIKSAATGQDLVLTPPGDMPPDVQRPFSFMEGPNPNKSGPVAPGGKGTAQSPLAQIINAAQPTPQPNVPRSLGAAATATEEIPQILREGAGLDRRGLPPNLETLWQESAFGKKPEGDVGASVRAENPEPKGRASIAPAPDRRSVQRVAQAEDDKLFAQARKELGEDATTEAVTKRMKELRNSSTE